eukprot:1179999-Prorocentrum_minimum.AAC.3
MHSTPQRPFPFSHPVSSSPLLSPLALLASHASLALLTVHAGTCSNVNGAHLAGDALVYGGAVEGLPALGALVLAVLVEPAIGAGGAVVEAPLGAVTGVGLEGVRRGPELVGAHLASHPARLNVQRVEALGALVLAVLVEPEIGAGGAGLLDLGVLDPLDPLLPPVLVALP